MNEDDQISVTLRRKDWVEIERALLDLDHADAEAEADAKVARNADSGVSIFRWYANSISLALIRPPIDQEIRHFAGLLVEEYIGEAEDYGSDKSVDDFFLYIFVKYQVQQDEKNCPGRDEPPNIDMMGF
jgi:hypothetical protein